MNNEALIEWSINRIQAEAEFYFHGEPRAYMEIEGPDQEQIRRIIFHTYAYLGETRRLLVRTLTYQLQDALRKLDEVPICIVWRTYPQLEEEELAWRFRMRFAVVDQNLTQLTLDLPDVEPGTTPPLLT